MDELVVGVMDGGGRRVEGELQGRDEVVGCMNCFLYILSVRKGLKHQVKFIFHIVILFQSVSIIKCKVTRQPWA